MTVFAPVAAADDTSRLQLDPFGHWPNMKSRVAGIGGTDPVIDPFAVFHTPYTAFVPGPVEFLIAFKGLKATKGTLVLLINELDEEGDAREIKNVHASLAAMANGGGTFRLTTVARGNATYAIHGQIHEETDAEATGLVIDCDRRTDESPMAVRLAAVRDSVFPHHYSGKLQNLVSSAPATLAAPVTQMCTASQMDEPVYAEWLRRMNRVPHRHRKQWEFVFICQALEHYGMLQPGKRGVGFGVGVEPLPAIFALNGVSSVATDLPAGDARAEAWSLTQQHGAALEDLRDPTIVPDDVFDAHVRYEPADMNDIPHHLRGFDFCWSSCAFEHLGSITNGLRFVEESLRTLKPGGLAVHTTELNLTSNFRTVSRGDTVLFRRRDIERLALILTAQGHEVMPIKYDQGEHPDDRFVDVPPYCSDVHLKVQLARYVSTSFGIIVRKKG